MPKPYSVVWTERSLKNAQDIADWIKYKFSKKEVDKFYSLLEDFEKIVTDFPDMYPESEIKTGVQQAVVHKNLTIYYQFEEPTITVIAMRDSRQDNIL